jgi:hypothetical protein
LISNFRRFVSVVSFILGVPPASEFYVPTFRNKIQTPGKHLTTKNTTYERNGSDDSGWRGLTGEGRAYRTYPGNWKCKGKGKGHRRTGHEGPEGE